MMLYKSKLHFYDQYTFKFGTHEILEGNKLYRYFIHYGPWIVGRYQTWATSVKLGPAH